MSASELLRGKRRLAHSGYLAINDGSLVDACRHFTSRGHIGPVQCTAASQDLTYIISGGVDYSMRIWRYSEAYEAYFLFAILGTRKPSEIEDPKSDQGFLCQLILPKPLDWTDQRRGITAVALMDSASTAYRVGEWVTVDPDSDFVQQAFDYLDFPWDDAVDKMLGKKFKVVDVEEDTEVVVLPGDGDGAIRFPVSCLTREKEPPLRNGPFVCGTAHGDVHILDVHSGPDGTVAHFRQLHTDAVNSIAVLATGQANDEFLVITGGSDGDAAILNVSCEESDFRAVGNLPSSFEEDTQDDEPPVLTLTKAEARQVDGAPLRLEHRIDGKPTPVQQVRHVGEHADDDEAVTFATLASDGVYLWSLQGQLLMKLTVQKPVLMYSPVTGKDELVELDIQEYHSLAAVNKESGALILASGAGYTAVWAIVDGLVHLPNFATLDKNERKAAWSKAVAKYTSTGACPVPVAAYSKEGVLVDLHKSSEKTSFAVELDNRLPHRVVLWNLLAVNPERLVLEPPGPAGLLIMPGRERLMMTLRHRAKVWCLSAMEDPGDSGKQDGGAVVITGCEDGCVYAWDVDGQDARQVYARMRSLSFLETFMPPLLLVVSTLQIMSFAFSATVPWKKEIRKPAVVVHRIMVMDVNVEVSVPKEMIFYPEILGTLGLMVFFVLTAVTGCVFLIDRLIMWLQDTRCFTAERKSRLGFCHIILQYIRYLRTFVVVTMQLCSTVLVVPMFTTIAAAVDCSNNHLESVPAIECYTGNQLKLLIAIWIIVPPYFFVLVPFATVSGDPFYIPTSTLYDYKIWLPGNMWRKAARRKATDQYLGFLHIRPSQAFNTPVVELLAKSFLPFAMAEFTSRPITQMVLICSVGVVLYVQSIKNPPYLEEKFQLLVQDLRLMTMTSMLIALLVAILDKYGHTEAILPVVLLLVCESAILVHLIYKFTTTRLRHRTVHQYNAEELLEDGKDDQEFTVEGDSV